MDNDDKRRARHPAERMRRLGADGGRPERFDARGRLGKAREQEKEVQTAFGIEAPVFDTSVPYRTEQVLTRGRISAAVTASEWMRKYENTQTRGFNAHHVYALRYAPNWDTAAMMSVGLPPNVSGIAAKVGLEDVSGNWFVSRIAAHDTAPPFACQHLLADVGHALYRERGFEWLYGYVDPELADDPDIYRVLKGVLVGHTKVTAGFDVNGNWTHPRDVVHKYGTQRTRRKTLPDGTVLPTVMELALEAYGDTVVMSEAGIGVKETWVVPIGPDTSVVRGRLAPFIDRPLELTE